MRIFLKNTTCKKKEEFIPIDPNHIKIYVCGPTVYRRPHIGNIRSSVLFDLLYRVLCKIYPKVSYVRNITDIDDNIINIANKNNESIQSLTSRISKHFREDLIHLNCLAPTYEPKVTDNINDIISMIINLIDRGHAYVTHGNVYFDISSFSNYGDLSGYQLSRPSVASKIVTSGFKKNSLDFSLWKPKKDHEKVFFSSPWGNGRPGWHIECSAMSKKYLGCNFDIHGGGTDLIFPHHTNEIAQSICESPGNKFAKYWIHNGLVTINNCKMSKSFENFITVSDLMKKGINPNAIRYFYFTTHYRQSLEFNKKILEDASKSISKIQRCLTSYRVQLNNKEVPKKFLSFLADDLNTPLALSYLHNLSNKILKGHTNSIHDLHNCCNLLGFNINHYNKAPYINDKIIQLAKKRNEMKKNSNWKEADRIRKDIRALGYKIIDTKSGYRLDLI